MNRALRPACHPHLVGGLALAAALLPSATTAAAPEAAPAAKGPYHVWPIPQEAEYDGERLLLGDAVIVVPAGERRAQFPGRLLAEIVADHFGVAIPVVAGEAPAGRIAITVGEATNPRVAAAAERRGLTVPSAAEGYALAVD
ncbi:MAG TPA: hypothetical protein VI669_17145, partial [Vicinamibacteria bacterium]